MTAYILAQRGWIAKKRENIGFRKEAAEGVQDFFAAAPIQQPVMHEGDAHVAYQLTAGRALEEPAQPIIYYRNCRPRDIQWV